MVLRALELAKVPPQLLDQETVKGGVPLLISMLTLTGADEPETTCEGTFIVILGRLMIPQ